MEPVRELAAQLREAIAEQSFERAAALLPGYASALQAALETAAPAARQAAISEAAGLLAGLRGLALARRAHLAARLDELNRLTPYLKSPPPRRRLQMEG